MEQRIVKLQIANEFIIGSGVSIGAVGSHDDVLLEMDFRNSAPWAGTTRRAIFSNALGENRTPILLTHNLLAEGHSEVYLVPVPAEAKDVAGECFLTVEGFISEGETEILRIVTEEATFRVRPSKLYHSENQSITPSEAEQLQASIEVLREHVDSNMTAHNDDDTAHPAIQEMIGSVGGATFTPVVSADGVLSWTNDKGLDNPEPVSIRGPKGDRGDTSPGGSSGTGKKNNLDGLNVLCLGDSITYGQGMSVSTRWANVMADMFSWNLTVKAKGGIPLSSYYYTANNTKDESICKYAEILATMKTKPDIVIVWGGHNDVDYRNSPLGSFDDLSAMDTSGVLDTYADKNTIKGALRYIAELVHHYAPKATLYVLTHEWIFLIPEPLKVPKGTTDNSRMIDEAVYDGAKYYGWVPINTQLCGITPFTKDIYTSDGIHPNTAGTTMIVNFLASELGKHYIIKNTETIPVSGVTLHKTSATIQVGDAEQLVASVTPSNATNKNLSWRSSNKEVLIVDNGWVGALREGNAIITVATEDGGFIAACDYTVKGTGPEPEPEVQDYWALEKATDVDHDDIAMTSYIGDVYFVYDSPEWLNILQGRTINGIWYKYAKTATGTVDIYLVDLANPTPTNWVKHHTETVAGVAGRAEEFVFADLEIPEGYTIGVKADTFVASAKGEDIDHYAIHYYADESTVTSAEYVATVYDFKIKGNNSPEPEVQDYWAVEKAYDIDHDDIAMTSFISNQYFVYDSPEWLNILHGHTINGIWFKYNQDASGTVNIYLVDLSNPAPANWVKHHSAEVAGVSGETEEITFPDLIVPAGYTVGVKAFKYVASAKGEDIDHYAIHYYADASATTASEYVATIYDFKVKA